MADVLIPSATAPAAPVSGARPVEVLPDAVPTGAAAPREALSGGAKARTGRGIVRGTLSASSAVLRRTVAIAAFLALWEVAPRVGLVDRTFLVPFSEAVRALLDLAGKGQLWDNTRVSLVRSLSGFLIAIGVGVPLGLVIGWYRPVATILNPLLELFRNTAVLAILPVFVLLLGIGETSKVTIVAYACAWPILLNTISAVRSVDPTLVKSARSMSLSAPRLFQKVILPASLPTVFTGVRMAGSASILVLVAAEMLGAKAGLGYLINASQQNFAIPDMYAGIIAISLIGVVFNQLLVSLERRATGWRVPQGD